MLKSELQFGYINIRKELNLNINEGETLYLNARIRQSSHRRKPVQLFIQDKTSYWSREKADYAAKSWQDVVISKTIRVGVKNICVGVYWEPGSDKEWIDIQSIRIYKGRAE